MALPGGSRARRSGRRAWLLVAALLVIGILVWLAWPQLQQRFAPQPATEPAPPTASLAPATGVQPTTSPAASASPQPTASEAPLAPPPPLAASDGFVRDLVGGLSGHPSFGRWLARSGLVDLFVVSVDNIADGVSPRKHLPFLRPREPFVAAGSEPDWTIDPRSYRRYDPIADVVGELDAAYCARIYRHLLPLFEESYAALGYPGEAFDARFERARAELLVAPILSERPALLEHVRRFEFADPAVEALSDAQKQLLRMGPRNVRRIQAKLREIGVALEARPD